MFTWEITVLTHHWLQLAGPGVSGSFGCGRWQVLLLTAKPAGCAWSYCPLPGGPSLLGPPRLGPSPPESEPNREDNVGHRMKWTIGTVGHHRRDT